MWPLPASPLAKKCQGRIAGSHNGGLHSCHRAHKDWKTSRIELAFNNTLEVFMNHKRAPVLSTSCHFIWCFLISCLALACCFINKSVSSIISAATCVSCQVLSFWAIQVHAEPPRPSCRKKNVAKNSPKLSKLTILTCSVVLPARIL